MSLMDYNIGPTTLGAIQQHHDITKEDVEVTMRKHRPYLDKKFLEITKTESGQEIMNFKFPMLEDSEHPKRRVRVIQDENGEPWFVAKDVCVILGIDTNNIQRDLDEDERMTLNKRAIGINERGNQDILVINEAGLYSLILRSRKPEAKRFKRWVTHEVLPTIRKTGGYIHATTEMSDAEIMARAMKVADSTLERVQKERDKALKANLELARRNVKLFHQNEAMTGPTEFFHNYMDSTGTMNFTAVAKVLDMNVSDLTRLLREHGFLYKSTYPSGQYKNLPMKHLQDRGLFKVLIAANAGNGWSGHQTRVVRRADFGRRVPQPLRIILAGHFLIPYLSPFPHAGWLVYG
ncbi:BRO family protein [Oceanidesulfovibrio marinus]|uniref:Bro-N domain-containing protein n=1 Tax=Oceanidesulfovibrio marinus TaxID=370038 RepID=A0ABX6NBQ5_9BACT|nr:BRO family protein [Oceanidesulfovibrio marinus]QJT08024.1 hypothetical protein E8L03_03370 [Oceanidesulfovibrio marinus]